MNKVTRHLLIGAAVASIIGVTVPVTNAEAKAKKFKCEGGNACKHKSKCKTAENACKGKNGCKGKGIVMTKDEEECNKLKEKNGGAPAAAPAPATGGAEQAAPPAGN